MTNINIPAGWRKLNKGERILKGDMYFNSGCSSPEESNNHTYTDNRSLVGFNNLVYIREINTEKVKTLQPGKSYTVKCNSVEQLHALYAFFVAIGWEWDYSNNIEDEARRTFPSYKYLVIHTDNNRLGGNSVAHRNHIEIGFNEVFTLFNVPQFPKTIELNDKYSAVVGVNGDVTVGCQTFSAEKVLNLAESVKKAKSLNK